jgi:hypothetical protein
MSRADPPLELRRVSERNLRESVASVNGYLKFASMVWIRALRQPILDALVVQRWSSDADRALRGFCDRHACDEVLLRIDTHNQRWSERRGGYILPRSKAGRVIKELSSEGRIAAFLEPLSPYRDRYSLAAITDDTQKTMTVEVVGPGFDASDLLRSDSSPHERFEVFVPKLPRPPREPVFAERTSVIGSADYKHTVQERLAKIAARLRNPAYPRAVIDSDGVRRGRLAEEGMQYLKRTKQTALLNRVDAYEPIPKRFLERFINGVGNIIDGLRRYNIRLGPTSFAGTFTERGRFVFWDFFPADLAKANELYLSA